MRDPEAIQDNLYEQILTHYKKLAEVQNNGELLIRSDDLDFQETRQGLLKIYMSPLKTDTTLRSWSVFVQHIRRQSGRHRHQGGIIIYVIEGEGMTEVNGEILEWQAGDLLLLPICPERCTHQHINKDASKGCKWVAFRHNAVRDYTANNIEQISNTPDLTGEEIQELKGKRRNKDWKSEVPGEQVSLVTHPDQLSSVSLFDKLIELRDYQRSRLEKSTWLIRGEDLPWELNPHGKMQWYLHPMIAYTCVQTNIFYRQEIPVGSRSGTQRTGGDAVFFISEGEGYTEVDGVRHEWKAHDVMTLPLRTQGVAYRHVNTGSIPVRLLGAEPNLVHTVGVDRHAGFEVLQPCPEFRK